MTKAHSLLRVRWPTRLALALLATIVAGTGIAQPLHRDGGRYDALLRYHETFYQHDLEAEDATAQAWIKWRVGYAAKPALVLDVDETSLSNWPALLANDIQVVLKGPCRLPQGPCGLTAWLAMARDQPIKPTLDLYGLARSLGVSIFFITGRDETLRAPTERNLRDAGYVKWTKLVMRPAGTTTPSAADYKAPERAKIEQRGYTIIANIGDQESDLAGGHADRSFKLSNPFYYIP